MNAADFYDAIQRELGFGELLMRRPTRLPGWEYHWTPRQMGTAHGCVLAITGEMTQGEAKHLAEILKTECRLQDEALRAKKKKG
jgi:hypothetical protein